MDKGKIRREILKRRSLLRQDELLEKSRSIAQRVTGSSEYQDASLLFLYASYSHEVDTSGLIEHALAEGKRVALPRVEGEDIRFYETASLQSLEEGAMGIREPVPGLCPVAEDKPGLIVMPGVAFDLSRNRIGYGKGFYDRFLTRLFREQGKVFLWALCFECQITRQIRAQDHDIRPDRLITEKRVIQ